MICGDFEARTWLRLTATHFIIVLSNWNINSMNSIHFNQVSINSNSLFAECNRTYYGNVGMTNYLELPRLRDERLPFLCELNFTAAGGTHGDIVQVCLFQVK